MCIDDDILDLRTWKNYETNIFFIFFYVDLRSKLVLCMNIWWITKIILACKIHTMEEEALGGSPKGGVEKN